MAIKQAPRRRLASIQLGAVVALALGAWMHPALSATGTGASCDQSMNALPMTEEGGNKLALQVVDHGDRDDAVHGDIGLDDPVGSLATDSLVDSSESGERVFLGGIIDDARLGELQPAASMELGAPVAVEKSDAIEKPAVVLERDRDGIQAELPGYPVEELLRFRQQMYRKDI